ncbi:Conserved_hypothetical protein [Hexamita inflata]|uniref:ISXO2-like transposase domain-containing protein n=1 Tax=Hexamita inflata TaxID=28002 RepID=A0AA86UE28_9EUKA|nr:Conserved hypothetical protein [Hexamita inflata]
MKELWTEYLINFVNIVKNILNVYSFMMEKTKNIIGENQLKETTKWFFSIRGRQSRIFRCFYILGRSIEEVQPLINKYCKIGDTVYSDGLATYKHLSSTFVHKSVNHSEHFADPEDPTNNINGLEGSHGALRKNQRSWFNLNKQKVTLLRFLLPSEIIWS